MAALINRLLFATDFSVCARKAEEYAVLLAGLDHAFVDVFHVLELYPGLDPEYPVTQVYVDQLHRETDAGLAETVRRIQDQRIPARGRSVLGIPSAQICVAAAESHADLVVLGTRGKTGLEHLLLGSTAERVVVNAPCPVLTVRVPVSRAGAGASVTPPREIHHILAPVDFSDCSLDALEYAVQIAKRLKVPMTILHVLEPISYGLDLTLIHTSERERTRVLLEEKLNGLAAAIASEGITAHHQIRGGMPGDSLVHFIEDNQCDLVVMGTHGRRGLSHLMNGSVAEAVLRRASCPVLTVKSPKFAPGHRRIVSKAPAEDNRTSHRNV